MVRERSRIAKTCPENSDIIEEFVIFVQENQTRIKPPVQEEEDAAIPSPANVKKQNADSVLVMPAYANESPHSRGTMLGASKLEEYMNEHDSRPITIPVGFQ